MSSTMNLLLIFFCISIHACSARCLSIVNAEETGKNCNLFTKLDKTTAVRLSSVVKDHQQLRTEGQDDDNTVKQGEVKATLKEEDSNVETSEENNSKSSLDDLPQTAKIKGLKTREARRSMLGSSSSNDESVDSNENKFMEDVVVMDYAQPHRKPPIHN